MPTGSERTFAQHPQQGQPQAALSLAQTALSKARPDRALLQQAVPAHRDPLRKNCQSLPFNAMHCSHKALEQNCQHGLINGNDREKSYVTNNTAFLVGQYLCWTELVRREIQFIDLGESNRTRDLLSLQDTIYSLWGTDQQPPLLRLFAGEQRAKMLWCLLHHGW
jgi:hypothetical protein